MWIFADADFAVTADRRSISGSVMKMGGNAVFAWRRKEQGDVALRTAEA